MFGKKKKDNKSPRRRTTDETGKGKETFSNSLQEATIRTIIAVGLFVLGVFLTLSSGPIGKGGPVGDSAYSIFHYLFGIGYYLMPILCFILCVAFFRSINKKLSMTHSIGGLLFFLSALSLINISLPSQGGVVGGFVSQPLISMFETYVSVIILLALLIISILTIFDAPLKFTFIKSMFKKREILAGTEDTGPEIIIANGEQLNLPDKKEPIEPKVEMSMVPKNQENKKGSVEEFGLGPMLLNGKEFSPPPLSLLEEDRGKPGVGDIKANSNIIKRTLQNFGINVEMDEISIGPSITRYALKPAEGVKLSRIVGLQNDLALALAAHPIRIEAPIPGKSLVGIEIPNSIKTTVGLATLLSSDEFQNSEKSLLVSLGKGVSGKSYFCNLAKMPHLLIAGATGSGKSVTIHAIITSLLYRNSPEDLRFIMIDPKRVELTLYNKIPHLLTPVITDAKKVIMALKWAAKEMDRRYDILESESVRDIESYHKNIATPARKRFEGKMMREEASKLPETMPYIVIIIDELADIMATYPRELEAAIVRLAQMSRAVGIHLILSTQRPSVNVITGLIKANIPASLALQVASQIDSRTILDGSGAEKLLGAGDMLFQSAEMSKPVSLQSAFIREPEVKAVTKYLKDAYADELQDEINFSAENTGNAIFSSGLGSEDDFGGDDDELYEEAKATVTGAGKASTSFLQRKLRIGYARAARLMDMLEERGIIGAGSGAKPREVISTGGYGEERFLTEKGQTLNTNSKGLTLGSETLRSPAELINSERFYPENGEEN